MASATAGLKTKRNSSGLISYNRDEPIVFGIQVTAVRFDNGIPTLDGAIDPGPLAVRSGNGQVTPAAENAMTGTLIGAQNGSPFIDLR